MRKTKNTHPIQADGKWDGATDVGSHLGLIMFYFSSCQCITHPAEQSVLIHILWANINFNPSGESGYDLSLCAPFLLSLGGSAGVPELGAVVLAGAARLLAVLLESGCCVERDNRGLCQNTVPCGSRLLTFCLFLTEQCLLLSL